MNLAVKNSFSGEIKIFRNLDATLKQVKNSLIIKRTYNIDSQILITKKGKKLRENNEKIFQISKDFLGETIDRDNPLQNKTFKQNLQNFDKEKIEVLKQKIYNFYTNEFNRNYTDSLKQKQYDYDKVQHVLEIAPKIFETEENYFELYNKCKSIINNFSEQISKYKLFLEQCSNQVSGNETLFVNIVNYYNDLKIQRIEAFKLFSQQREINKNTEQKFDQALEQLQNIELHPQLQSNGNKDKMIKWKQKCQGFQNYMKKYLEDKNLSIKSIKEIIINNNNKVKNYVKQWIDLEQNLDQKCNKIQKKVSSFLKDFIQLYTQLREKLIHSIELNPGFNNSLILISNQKKYDEKLEEFQNIYSDIESQLHNFQTDIQNLSNKYIENIDILQQNQKIVFNIDQKLSQIEKDFKVQFHKDIEKMEQDFSSLLKPSLLPQGYQDFIQEIQRRRKVFHELNLIVEKVSETVNVENQNRKKFLTKYGNILPENFLHIIPHLKDNLKCKFILDLQELEKLPKIEFEQQEELKEINEQTKQDNDSYQELQAIKKIINNSVKQTKKFEEQQLEQLKTSTQIKDFMKYFLIENSKFCIKKFQNLYYQQYQQSKNSYEQEISSLKNIIQNNEQNQDIKIKQLQQQLEDSKQKIKDQQEQIEILEEREMNYEEDSTSLKFILEGYKNDLHTAHLQVQKDKKLQQKYISKLKGIKKLIAQHKKNIQQIRIDIQNQIQKSLKDEILIIQQSQINQRVKRYEQLLDNNELEINILKQELQTNKINIKNQQNIIKKDYQKQINKTISFNIIQQKQKFIFLPFSQGVYYNLLPFSNQLIKLNIESMENKFKKIIEVSNFVIIGDCIVNNNIADIQNLEGIYSFDKETIELFNILDLEK